MASSMLRKCIKSAKLKHCEIPTAQLKAVRAHVVGTTHRQLINRFKGDAKSCKECCTPAAALSRLAKSKRASAK
eukprot:scaffold271900_cov17-Prasinocladus_malaysianus.AAC.1